MKKAFLPLVSVLLCFQITIPQTALGCVNTTYSRTHEVQITNDLVKIIMGQFATHGSAFYEADLVRTSELLSKDSQDVEARNDRAVALLKLERFDEAEAEFLEIEKDFPARYKTHANLGVLYKKTGEFQKAIDHTKMALEIKPEGHLGLGDYYLKMLEWRKDYADYGIDVKSNFLGIPYADMPEAVVNSPTVNKEYLRTLIIADRHFSDAYFVLGDVLYSEGDLELAYRCYSRAESLTSEFDESALHFLSERKRIIRGEWSKVADSKWGHISSRQIFQEDLSREIRGANKWHQQFQKIEGEMLAAGQKVDFELVKTEMESRSIHGPRYVKGGVVKGRMDFSWGSVLPMLVMFAFVLPIVIWIVLAIRGKLRQ